MKNQFTTGKLKVLMKEMADLTLPECQSACVVPLSCCDSMYCAITEIYARDFFNITLEPTENSSLKFMGPSGCTVAPYLRPLCTLHTCEVNSLGYKRHDPGLAWTNSYFELREKIDDLLGEIL
jgi:hypothetical protein